MNVTQTSLQDRIRSAYRACSTGPGTWVMIADLRTHLADLSREEQDAALLLMVREPGVDIVPESNQKILTAADREGAVWIGNQPNHVIKIG